MRGRGSQCLLAGACHALWGAIAVPVAAQVTPSTTEIPTPPRTDESNSQIVVTARKVEESLADVSASLSVRSGNELREAGIRTPDELAERFTGLTVLPNPTGNLVFVRGVGGFALTANTDPAIGWNYDGVFVARPVGTSGQLFDLERVELLKGPQGALHGRNATGGAVFVVPKRPAFGQTGGYARVSYGSMDNGTAEAALNLSLGTDHALRVSGWLSQQDNVFRGYRGGPSQQSARVQWMAAPSSDVSIRLAGDFTRLGGVGIGTTYAGKYQFDRVLNAYSFVPSGLRQDAGIYTDEAQAFRQSIILAALGRPAGRLSSIPFQDSEFSGLTAEAEVGLGFADLTIQPSVRRSSLDAIAPGAPFGYRHLEEHRQTGVEARLTGRGGSLTWLAGGTLHQERADVANRLSFDFQAVFQDESYRTKSQSAFAQATLAVSPGVRFEGSARVLRDRRNQRVAAETVTLSCTLIVVGAPRCPDAPVIGLFDSIEDIDLPVPALGAPPNSIFIDGAPTGARVGRSASSNVLGSTDTSVSWRLGAEADFGTEFLVYANVGSANRPGGINNAVGFETYRPERLTAYTVGTRWSPASGRLDAAAELFWWDYRNQHVTSLQPDLGSPPALRQITRNIGRSRIRGADVELTSRPDGNTDVRIAVQYLDSRYLSFDFLQASSAVPPLTGCVATPISTTLYDVDCTDQRPFASPEWTTTLRVERRFPISSGEIALRFHSRAVSSQGIGAAFLEEQTIPAHWVSDAELSFDTPGRRFGAGVYIRNLGGERVRNWAIFHPVTNALVTSSSAPRNLGVRVSARF